MRVVIVHGSYGSSGGNWFPWLARRVEELGHDAVVPQLPTPIGQNLSNWIRVFHSEVGALSSETMLVGHSLGVAFILRLLERTEEPVAAAFLVAGFLGPLGLPDFDPLNATFVFEPTDWSQLRRSARSFWVYSSDNDPYVPLQKGEHIASKLGVPLVVLEGAGHINTEAGFTSFPALLNDLEIVSRR